MATKSTVSEELQKNEENLCKHCRKKVKSQVNCRNCGSSFHPSCAAQAKVVDKQNKVFCCKPHSKIEVIYDKNNQNNQEMDERKMKAFLEKTLNDILIPFKKSIQEEMQNIKESVQFISDSFDDFKTKIEENVRNAEQLEIESNKLKAKVQVLEIKMNEMEQKNLKNNIVVTGIPTQTSENLPKITKKLLQVLKLDELEEDIVNSYRMGKHDKAPILIERKNLNSKIKIITAVKQKKGIRVNECGFEGTNNNIFFNDELTTFNKQLFKKVRDFKTSNKCKGAFCANGRVYLRRNDSEPPIRIKNEDDLMALSNRS